MLNSTDDERQAPSALRLAGGAPLPEGLPDGDCRETPAFVALQSEMDKLVALSGLEAPDWHKVTGLATEVLTLHGKDLAAAVWLVAGACREAGAAGLADAVHALREMTLGYWTTMSPPPARRRARANLYDWLCEQLDQQTEIIAKSGVSTGDRHAELLADWSAIEDFLATQQIDCASLSRIRRRLTTLPAGTEVDSSGETIGTPDHARRLDDAGHHVAGDTLLAEASAAARRPLDAVESESSAEAAYIGEEPIREDNARKMAARFLHGWGSLLHVCVGAVPALAFVYRLKRASVWMLIDSAPPATARRTRISPPADSVRSTLRALLDAGNATAIVQFCESRLDEFPFWLDLNRHCAQALARFDAHDAAHAVAHETRGFCARLPSMTTQQFSDGTPFADAMTQEWIGDKRTVAQVPPQSDGDVLATALEAAHMQVSGGDLDAAMQQLEALAQREPGGRDRYRVRLAQCELLQRSGATQALRGVVGALVHETARRELADWEPALARRALSLAVAVNGDDHIASDGPKTWLTALAAVDLDTAWRLARRGV